MKLTLQIILVEEEKEEKKKEKKKKKKNVENINDAEAIQEKEKKEKKKEKIISETIHHYAVIYHVSFKKNVTLNQSNNVYKHRQLIN